MHSSTNIIPPAPLGGDTLRYQWRKARALIDQFWVRWSREYLTTLQKRTKWASYQSDLYKGQLVLMVDELMPRDQWRIARVESFVGGEGPVRRVIVKTASGKAFERHCSKVVALELE